MEDRPVPASGRKQSPRKISRNYRGKRLVAKADQDHHGSHSSNKDFPRIVDSNAKEENKRMRAETKQEQRMGHRHCGVTELFDIGVSFLFDWACANELFSAPL